MDILPLPLLPATTTVFRAVNVMSAMQAGGIVAAADDRLPRIFTLDQLLEAHRLDLNVPLFKLETGYDALDHSAQFDPIYADPQQDLSLASRIFSMESHDYVLTRRYAFEASVVTRSEQFAYLMRGTVILCRCRQDRRHVWRPTQLNRSGYCNNDTSRVDCR